MDGSGRRYGAFLSYSHADTEIARWLHRRLESYHTPLQLRGREGRLGPIPARIGKVYRDRDEASAGGELAQEIGAALQESDALVVLCSPNSARSRSVDEEISRFKAMGRGGRIIPVIVAGEPPDCWPPSLREGGDRLCADFRPGKDGRDNGLMKVIAGLLGAGLDELIQRARIARRWRMRIMTGLAALFAGLAVLASAAAYVAIDRSGRLQSALVAILDAIVTDVSDVFTRSEFGDGSVTTTEAVLALERAERQVSIAISLAPGNDQLLTEEASVRLAFAVLHQRVGQPQQALESALRAQAIIAELERDGPLAAEDAWMPMAVEETIGDVALSEGRGADALAAFQSMLELARAASDQGRTAIGLERTGEVLLSHGRVAEALTAYEEALDIERELAAQSPEDFDTARGVPVALNRIGDIRFAQGQFDEALAAFEEALTISRDLAARAPDNVVFLRDVSVGLDRTGDVHLRQGRIDVALAAFKESLRIRRELVSQDPLNLSYRGDVAVSLEKVGDGLLDQGKDDAALANYEESASIRRDLVERDPDTLGHRRNVSVSLDRISTVRRRQGKFLEALVAAEEGLVISRDVAAADPLNLQYQSDLAVGMQSVATLLLNLGRPEEALAAAEESVVITRALVAANPQSPNYRRRLTGGLERVLSAQVALGRLDAATTGAALISEWEAALAEGLADPAAAAPDFVNLSWYAILARDFTGAEEAARRSMELQPSWSSEVNLAHALMLQDRLAEADAIYDSHRGERRDFDGRRWEDIVAGDFAAFRANGVVHPHMDVVLERLTP